MNIARQIDRKWQLHEPRSCRAVLPWQLSLCVQWPAWELCGTAVFLLGFAGMLHPSEMISLVRKDLVFPIATSTTKLVLCICGSEARKQLGLLGDNTVALMMKVSFKLLKLLLESCLWKAVCMQCSHFQTTVGCYSSAASGSISTKGPRSHARCASWLRRHLVLLCH